MSQNSNVLMLFFEDKAQHESCVLAIVNLMRGDDAKSQVWQEQLGVDLTSHWHEDWFNHEFRAQPEFIRLAFDSSTTSSLPLELLLSLFEHGLQAAVIEVFHDQVGETERHHFLAGALVNPDDLYRHKPELRVIVEQEVGEVDDEDGCTEVRVRRPVPLRKLIAEAHKNEARAREAVEGIVSLANLVALIRASGRHAEVDALKHSLARLLLGFVLKRTETGYAFAVPLFAWQFDREELRLLLQQELVSLGDVAG